MRGRHFKGYLIKDIKTCIGANADIYMERLQKRRSGRITFNWAAAFLLMLLIEGIVYLAGDLIICLN